MRLGQVRVEALAGPSLRSVLHLTGPVGKDIQTPPLFASNQDEQKQLESEGPPMNRREALIRTVALPSAAALAVPVKVLEGVIHAQGRPGHDRRGADKLPLHERLVRQRVRFFQPFHVGNALQHPPRVVFA